MGSMKDERNAVHTIGIARATQMAYLAGQAIGDFLSVDHAVKVGRRANEEDFGVYDVETIDGKFFAGIEDSVETYIRSRIEWRRPECIRE